MVGGGLENDGVVDDLAFVVQKGAVDAAPRVEGFAGRAHAGPQVVGEAPLEQIQGLRAVDHDHGHVAGVEHAGGGQDRQVFVFGR